MRDKTCRCGRHMVRLLNGGGAGWWLCQGCDAPSTGHEATWERTGTFAREES